MLRVGIAEADITPAPGLPRAGMPNPQPGQGTAWPLMARVVVFDDGTRIAAVVVLDLLFLTAQTVAEYRQAMTAGTGVSPADVMISCTHTHWAPHTAAIMDEDPAYEYMDFLRARLVEVMARALANRRPARLLAGRARAPGWAFNRRPVYRTEHGEQVGTQGPWGVPEFVGMEGPDDPDLQVLVARGNDGKVLGGLVNFACHTTVGPDDPLYSSDYPGPLTERLAERYGGIFGFMQGCAGNIWQMDRSPSAPPRQTGSEHTRRMGEALAEKAAEAIDGARAVPADGHDARVRVARELLRIPHRRPTAEQVAQAKWFLEKRPDDVDLRAHHYRMYGHDHTFYTDWSAMDQPGPRSGVLWQEEWFARGTIGMWEWQRRASTRDLIEDVDVQVIVIGDVALVGYPAEYFVEFGLQTKAGSPFANTLVGELANGWHGYVPTAEAFAHGGYETRFGDASRLVPEAGDVICETGLRLLRQLR